MKIFVSVGTRPNQFDRLVKEMDLLAKNKTFQVFIQNGNSAYEPKYAKYSKFLNYNEQLKEIKSSDIIVMHAGAGTLIDALSNNKAIILFPRLEKYGEHTNDHQIELCQAIKKKYAIPYTLNEKELPVLIKNIKPYSSKTTHKESKLLNEIKSLLD